MAGGKGSRNRSRPRARTAAAVVPLSRARAGGNRLELHRIAPSGRSLLVGLLILVVAVGLYAAARGTSAFAVRQIAVEGASPEVAAEVRKVLAPAVGQSLLALDLSELAQRAGTVPMVAGATFDRGYPHTLRIHVVPELPVAVLRQGSSSWLAAASGRVVADLDQGARPALPRVWLPREVDVRLGEPVRGLQRRAVATVAPLAGRPFVARVTAVVATEDELTLRLRNGIELRLGDSTDLAVKLEVARRILPSLEAGPGYLDISVPDRPVAGQTLNSQIEVEASTSTNP